MENFTVKKEISISGDTYAEVFKDGKRVLITLWIGESDAQLIEQAKQLS